MIACSLLALLVAGPAPGATLSGTVRESPEGGPIESAVVVAYDLRLDYHYTLTDADGNWEIDGVEAGAWRLRVQAPGNENRVSRFYPATRDYCSAQLLWLDEQETADGLDVDLEAGGELAGTLVDQQGNPVADATVQADGVDATVTGLYRSASTDSQGNFLIRGLDATATESTGWTCQVSVDGWPGQLLGDPPVYDDNDAQVYRVGAGGHVDVGTIHLLDGISVGGQVRGPDGPVPEATVYAYAAGQILTEQTDAEGRFDAVGLPPGSVLLWASATGIATTYYPNLDRPDQYVDVLGEGEVRDDLDMDAPAEAILEIHFTGAEAGVRAMLYNSTYNVAKGSSSDDEGVVALHGLYGGTYTLYAWGYPVDRVNTWVDAVDGEPTPFTIPEGETTRLDVDLGPGARLSGTLHDDFGAPVYGASISVTPTSGDTWSTVSEHDGSWSIGGLPAGPWRVEFSYGAYCAQDPDYVSLVWPGVPDSSRAEAVVLAEGEHREALDVVMPRDDDHDGMSDRWEVSNGLDPSRDDSAEDPDGDGVSNLDEYLLGTDPNQKDAAGGGCGCGSAARPRLPWLALLGLLLVGQRRRRR